MTDATDALTAQEAAKFLLRIDEGKEAGLPENALAWMRAQHTNVEIAFESGWKLRVFKDGCDGLDDWDYVDGVISPDGREYDAEPGENQSWEAFVFDWFSVSRCGPRAIKAMRLHTVPKDRDSPGWVSETDTRADAEILHALEREAESSPAVMRWGDVVVLDEWVLA